MHIYIRTGDNENTGIEFLNGKGWELSGYERKGFDYTPRRATHADTFLRNVGRAKVYHSKVVKRR